MIEIYIINPTKICVNGPMIVVGEEGAVFQASPKEDLRIRHYTHRSLKDTKYIRIANDTRK